MDKDEIFTLAGQKLANNNIEEVQQHSKLVERIGYFFWEPTRGGQQFLLGFDGGYLYGSSALTPDDIIAAYKEGKRS